MGWAGMLREEGRTSEMEAYGEGKVKGLVKWDGKAC